MKRILLFVSALALNAGSVSDAPYWTGELGIIRGSSNSFTDTKLGPDVGLAWTLPITQRQGFRGWSDYSSIQGNRDAWVQVPDANSLPFPWKMVPGRGKWEQSALTLGLDYRVSFLRSGTTPYFFLGAIAGRIHAINTFDGGGYDLRKEETTFKSGGSWGLGMQFANKVDIELRIRGFNGYDNSGFYNLVFGYHF